MLKHLEAIRFNDSELTDALDWLPKWDRFFNDDNHHAVFYSLFWTNLNANIFQNKLGDIAKAKAADQEMRAVQILLERPGDKWLDDSTTKGKTEKNCGGACSTGQSSPATPWARAA